MALAPRQTRFLLVFAVLLIAFYAFITIGWVDTHVVLPFTAALARVSAAAFNAIHEPVHLDGTEIAGSRFAVDIPGGFNGLEAALFLAAGAAAFYPPPPQRAGGARFAGALPPTPQ